MQASDTSGMKIVLVGFMGTGKSTVGAHLGRTWNGDLIDTDGMVEEAAGVTISQIFETEGESVFRRKETEALREALGRSGRWIISTGGGVVVTDENRRLLTEKDGDPCCVVWLTASPETVLERTAANDDRPLLRGEDPAEKVRTMLADRDPWYREVADLVVETDGLSAEDVAYGVSESIHFAFG